MTTLAWILLGKAAFLIAVLEFAIILFLLPSRRKARQLQEATDQNITVLNVVTAIKEYLSKSYTVVDFYLRHEAEQQVTGERGTIDARERCAAVKALYRGLPIRLDHRNPIDKGILKLHNTDPLTFVPVEIKTEGTCWNLNACYDNICSCYGKKKSKCWIDSGRRCQGKDLSYEEKLAKCFSCRSFLPIGLFLIQGTVPSSLSKRLNSRFGGMLRAAVMYDRAHYSATIDALTGIPNRRHLMSTLSTVLNISLRTEQSLCVVMFDIDKFKSFNDTYGHQIGDAVLRQLAQCVRDALRRKADTVGRYGGEEFTIILPNTLKTDGMHIIDQICSDVAQHEFETEAGSLRVTISMGLAAAPEDARTEGDLIEMADAALYHSKESGRNRVCAYTQYMEKKKKRPK